MGSTGNAGGTRAQSACYGGVARLGGIPRTRKKTRIEPNVPARPKSLHDHVKLPAAGSHAVYTDGDRDSLHAPLENRGRTTVVQTVGGRREAAFLQAGGPRGGGGRAFQQGKDTILKKNNYCWKRNLNRLGPNKKLTGSLEIRR